MKYKIRQDMKRGKRDISSKCTKKQTDVMLSESVNLTEEFPEYFKKVDVMIIICAYHITSHW